MSFPWAVAFLFAGKACNKSAVGHSLTLSPFPFSYCYQLAAGLSGPFLWWFPGTFYLKELSGFVDHGLLGEEKKQFINIIFF